MSNVLPPPERVLPTLNQDGSRRWIRPKLYKGAHYHRRRVVAYALMVLFAIVPWLRVGGKPILLLDIPHREFTLFGYTFLPTDGVLLMFLVLAIFVGIVLLTALWGRVWCGWGCPQTVYMEFLFRPLENLFEGSRGQQQKLDREGPNLRRVLKTIAFLGLAFIIGNIFLSYFVGPWQLIAYMGQSPVDHPTPFLVVALTTGLVFFDFGYFREQMCTVICPYARIQSVLLDPKSLIVAYDSTRGEPRRGWAPKQDVGVAQQGDCIDCNACVVACPTGIDIREGLQLECIACTQCADACDSIMARVGKPLGLIRYGSQQEFSTGKKGSVWRVRTIVYPTILAVLIGLLLLFGGKRGHAEVTVLRGATPFTLMGEQVQNQIRIKVRNRGADAAAFDVELLGAEGAQLVAPENPLSVAAGEQRTTSVFVLAPRALFEHGVREIEFSVSTESGFETRVPYKLLGPTP